MPSVTSPADRSKTLLSEPEAKRMVLATMLTSMTAVDYALDFLSEWDFRHGEMPTISSRIFAVMADMAASEMLITVDHVALRLDEDARPNLRSLGQPAGWAAFTEAVEKVRECAVRNRLALGYERLSQACLDPAIPLTEIARSAAEATEAEVPLDPVEVSDVSDIMDRDFTYDWVVPDFIERGDRIMVTGPEGWGKSTYLRQLALEIALGLHPVQLHAKIEPRRVLVVDCENSERQVGRAFDHLCSVGGRPPRGNLSVVVRRQGMDLLRYSDQRWLESHLRQLRPDVLLIGPLYKLFVAEPKDEATARQVAWIFDRWRKRYGFALVIEAHAPHGFADDRSNFRPYGASLWLRWPEFGFALKRDDQNKDRANVVHWRGKRDGDRQWPEKLGRGERGKWPWVVLP